mmetsp:Transcript_2132/g.6563  ORF Transcript_2132/g.6563 Transcript_2132/m.6563 type:complete len:212 (-) Transcript_2132:330-965(-)
METCVAQPRWDFSERLPMRHQRWRLACCCTRHVASWRSPRRSNAYLLDAHALLSEAPFCPKVGHPRLLPPGPCLPRGLGRRERHGLFPALRAADSPPLAHRLRRLPSAEEGSPRGARWLPRHPRAQAHLRRCRRRLRFGRPLQSRSSLRAAERRSRMSQPGRFARSACSPASSAAWPAVGRTCCRRCCHTLRRLRRSRGSPWFGRGTPCPP